MLLASLDVWHSRPIAPTRRLAVGDGFLPIDPAPGPGGLLLGAIVARSSRSFDADIRSDMKILMSQVERGLTIGQPRLRYRLQKDRIGLTRSRHRLLQGPDGLRFELETRKIAPAQSVLAAVYAVTELPADKKHDVMAVLHKGLKWQGEDGPGLIDHLVGKDVAMRLRSGAFAVASDPMQWALGVLELDLFDEPNPRQVQRQYRSLIRTAHPDHGGGAHHAADRIEELGKARDILLK
ncbi:MAG: hypothetical protein HKN94_02975 [Acidimicrobiales bacterium]|nr:hypothetical protein [Acidimicrobiales bacterium]RZV48678.1 MAG: hypothetical protein EX269_00975 [Acidimicrobiales bacterium]